ncbi:MAG TPA: hypothetical protein VEA61_05010 [Allosphingosinicella sp.]|nr:hypothetical protein [Allosphingosinicella sp.]
MSPEGAGLPEVTLEDPRLAALALDRAGQGLDFADALHLAAARDCTAFLSFDRRLAKAATGVAEMRVAVA